MVGSTYNFSVILLILLLAPTTASAIGALDQEFVGSSSPSTMPIHSGLDGAQSAIVSSQSELGSLKLAIGKSATTGDLEELIVEIRPADASGVPDNDDSHILGSFTVFGSELSTAPSVSTLYEIDFSPIHLGLAAGQRISIVLRSTVGPGDAFLWAGDLTGGYAGGAAYDRVGTWQLSPNAADAGFQIFIVPEPQAAIVAALLTLSMFRRVRRA